MCLKNKITSIALCLSLSLIGCVLISTQSANAQENSFLDALQSKIQQLSSQIASLSAALTTRVCVPKTCANLGTNCGFQNNGCGDTISCGTCPSNQTCSVGKCVISSANVCGNGKCEIGETAASCPRDCCKSQVNAQIAILQEQLVALNAQSSQNSSATTKEQLAEQIAALQSQLSSLMTTCTGTSVCGNGKCEADETAATCPADCGSTNCIAEGNTIVIYPGAAKCCPGLTASSVFSSCTEPITYLNGLSSMPNNTPLSGTSICTKCGNDICGLGENKCNCPADCKISANFIPASIVTSSTQPAGAIPATLTNTFSIQVTTKNGDVYLPKAGAFTVAVLKDNETDVTKYHIGSVYSQPSGTISIGDSYKIPQGTTATFSVTATHTTAVAGNYHLQMAVISWSTLDGGAYTNWVPTIPSIWAGKTVYLQGSNATVCGNGTCEAGENVTNCSADCNTNACIGVNEGHEVKPGQSCCAGLSPLVDKYSQFTENWTCLLMPTPRTVCAKCGDGICGPGESYCSCPRDCCTPGTISGCKVCQTSPSQIWKDDNTKCANGQICSNGQCLLVSSCGNGKCETGETAASCPRDCCKPPVNEQIAILQEQLAVLNTQSSQNPSATTKKQLAEQIAILQSQLSSLMTNCTGTSVCGNGKCEADETTAGCPTDCGTCRTGQTKKYSCPDGTQVAWCNCSNNNWICANFPETQCHSSCVPKACSGSGRVCGTQSDGCGGTLNCGTCPSGQSCDNRGTCVLPAAKSTLTVSIDANSPKSRNIIADSNHEIAGASLLVIDLKAANDNLSIDSLSANFAINNTNRSVAPETAYLYDDHGIVIGTAAPNSSGMVSFTSLNYSIAKGATKTFTLKVDDTISEPNGTTHVSNDDGQRYIVSVPAGGVTFKQTNGATGVGAGSATSYAAFAYAEGPIFTLASANTTSTQARRSGTSSTISTTFNVQVQAVSGDVYIPNSRTGSFGFDYEKDGVDITTGTVTGVTYTQPSGTVASGNYYKVAQGTTAIFVINVFYSEINKPGLYDLKMKNIFWKHTANGEFISSNYMDADSSMISNGAYLQ